MRKNDIVVEASLSDIRRFLWNGGVNPVHYVAVMSDATDRLDLFVDDRALAFVLDELSLSAE